MTSPGDDWQTAETAPLLEAIVSLSTVDEAAAFLRDLCTLRELEEITQRWAVVRLLDCKVCPIGRLPNGREPRPPP